MTTTAPEHTIDALCTRSHAISLEKGWVTEKGDPRRFSTITSLNHTELSEAFEEYRNNKPLNEVWYEVKTRQGGSPLATTKSMTRAEMKEAEKLDGKFGRGDLFLDAKPCGIPIELADFVIRVAQHVGTAGKGAMLQEVVSSYVGGEDNHPDLDTLIAEVHLSVSLAYQSKKIHERAGDHDNNGYLSPLADALVEVFAFCKSNDIDLWAAIDEKEAYNRTRPMKHGGKKV